MAVQEWAAEYQLPVKHPLFLYWVQDPVSELDSLKLSGESTWMINVLVGLIGIPGLSFFLWYILPSWTDKRYFASNLELILDAEKKEEAFYGAMKQRKSFDSNSVATPRGGGVNFGVVPGGIGTTGPEGKSNPAAQL